jgi:hypothetical protein
MHCQSDVFAARRYLYELNRATPNLKSSRSPLILEKIHEKRVRSRLIQQLRMPQRQEFQASPELPDQSRSPSGSYLDVATGVEFRDLRKFRDRVDIAGGEHMDCKYLICQD